MTAAWVASTVRGTQLLRRTEGPWLLGALSTAESWPAAVEVLGRTSYGASLPPDADRGAAHRAALAATAWQLRVLAGWLPPTSTWLARLAGAPIEIANIEQRLAELDGVAPHVAPIDLGPLSVTGHRALTAASRQELRSVLARSAWADPGGDEAATISTGLRLAWARRALQAPSIVRPWARGWAVVVVAGQRFVFDRDIATDLYRDVDRLVGHGWRSARSVDELRRSAMSSASWPLDGIDDPAELWRAEVALARRVAADAGRVAAVRRYGPDTVAAILALMLLDLRRVVAGIAVAGESVPPEVLDAVA